jgi:hypothetical protein
MILTQTAQTTLYNSFSISATKMRLKGFNGTPGGAIPWNSASLAITWGTPTTTNIPLGMFALPISGNYTFDITVPAGTTISVLQVEILDSSDNVIYYGDIDSDSTAVLNASGKYGVTNLFVLLGA